MGYRLLAELQPEIYIQIATTLIKIPLPVVLVSRRPTLKRGSGETVYKKFGAAGMLEAPIRSLHFKFIM